MRCVTKYNFVVSWHYFVVSVIWFVRLEDLLGLIEPCKRWGSGCTPPILGTVQVPDMVVKPCKGFGFGKWDSATENFREWVWISYLKFFLWGFLVCAIRHIVKKGLLRHFITPKNCTKIMQKILHIYSILHKNSLKIPHISCIYYTKKYYMRQI